MQNSIEYHRKWRKNNPEKVAKYRAKWNKINRKRKREYQRKWFNKHRGDIRKKTLKSQGNHCAICEAKTPGGHGIWHTDHCHKTKKLRGVLCANCNWGLGHFKDNPALLRTAAKYLEKHK